MPLIDPVLLKEPIVKREPVVLPLSILAALQFFFAGTSGISILSGNDTIAAIMAVGGLATAAAQVGVQFWVRGQVSPVAPDGKSINVDFAPVFEPVSHLAENPQHDYADLGGTDPGYHPEDDPQPRYGRDDDGDGTPDLA